MEGTFRNIYLQIVCCSGYISDVGTSGGLVYFSSLKNDWVLSEKLDLEVWLKRRESSQIFSFDSRGN